MKLLYNRIVFVFRKQEGDVDLWQLFDVAKTEGCAFGVR